MAKKILFLFLFISLILNLIADNQDFLGLKDKAYCDAKAKNEEEKIVCYNEAAVSYAYLGDQQSAVSTCIAIINLNLQGDQIKVAQAQANSCLMDVAVKFEDSTICNQITTPIFQSGSILVGNEVPTKEICIEKVEKKNRVLTYYGFSGNNTAPRYTCPLMFILIGMGTLIIIKRN